MDLKIEENLREKYDAISSLLDERSRRIWAAIESKQLGHGGIAAVSRATGLSITTIYQGLQDLESKEQGGQVLARKAIRSPGGGRKSLVSKDAILLRDLEALVEPVTRGDPESPLHWTSKSTRKLAEELSDRGHQIGRQKVSELLADLGYSLQANQKVREGATHEDRDQQFGYINDQVKGFQSLGEPVISVDTKKKELVGDFKRPGRAWRPIGQPEKVRVHDFVDRELGKVNPYGVYDQTTNTGWVSVGTDHDTAEFAVESIRRWWHKMGIAYYPKAHKLLITADGGGSNGYRVKLWKVALQQLADELDLAIHVCHFPPGTSKWNKIEHQMFSYISMNWRGKPLISHEVVVNLIGHTTTAKGLKIVAELDTNAYQTGVKITDKVLASINLKRAEFHGEWNYVIKPKCSGY